MTMNSVTSSKCPNCGKDLVVQEKFCPHCGTSLDSASDQNKKLARRLFEKAQFNYNQDRGLTQALADCEQVIEYEPAFAEAHNLRGLILDALNRTDEAILEYREAMRLDPNSKDAQANLRDAEGEQISSGYGMSSGMYDNEETGGLRRLLVSGGIGLLLLLLMAGGYYFVSQNVLPELGPTTELVFIPDTQDGVAVSKEDMENAAGVLTERSKLLGYSQVRFKVTSSGQIIAKVPLTINANELASQIDQVGLLEFVDFGDEDIAVGQEVRTDIESPYLAQVDGKTWHTIISNDAITSADAVTPYGSYQVSFTLSDEGKQVFAFHTAKHINKYLGIVLDKIVISNPIIKQAITQGQGVITGNFTHERAVQLATVLNTSPLPFPIKLVEK